MEGSKERSVSEQNIFENYKGYDMSFLRGMAILIPKMDLKMVNKPDDVIKLLNPYFSKEFDHCYGNPERRLEAMFDIKDKWTRAELEVYLLPFIDLNLKFDNYLLKNTRMIKEFNPFDKEKDIVYYMKKF